MHVWPRRVVMCFLKTSTYIVCVNIYIFKYYQYILWHNMSYIIMYIYIYVYIYIWISTYTSHLFTCFPIQLWRPRTRCPPAASAAHPARQRFCRSGAGSTKTWLVNEGKSRCTNVGIAAHHCQETSVYKTNEKGFFSLLHVLYLQLTAGLPVLSRT